MIAGAPLWESEDAARATAGANTRAWQANGISIDTRSLMRHDLFIALVGDNRDGHEFVAAAFAAGASVALVARKLAAFPADAALLVVPDTQAALEALGRAGRARARAKIVAVTGSVGKTTTKEMLRLMLSRAGSVAASAASYNNHWGVPLSLARMARDADYGVFEIGMNHAGEIRALVAQVRPHVALITAIAPAHLEYFGTVEKIADAKAEIFSGLEPGGAALIPADNEQASCLRAHAKDAGVAHILEFGTVSGAEARLISAETFGDGQHVVAEIGGKPLRFKIGAAGKHIAMNAMAALLAARELGADIRNAAHALEEFTSLSGRGARFVASGIIVIDESYNANPVSMAAALALLGDTLPTAKGRRIAVLGDMLELGRDAAALHRGLAGDIAAARADLVFLCGPQMASLWDALPPAQRGAYCETSAALWTRLSDTLHEGDVVLVKGSFGSRMSVVIDGLKRLVSAQRA